METVQNEINLKEAAAKAAEAKAFLAARQAKRLAVEKKFKALMDSLRDLSREVKADLKAEEPAQSDLQSYFLDLQRKVEMTDLDAPNTAALEDVAYYGQVIVDSYDKDQIVEMLDKAVGELDESALGYMERSERKRVECLDAALLRLPSFE